MDSEQRTTLWDRVRERVSAWQVAVDHFSETERAILAFGQRDGLPVVLKVIKHRGNEWRSGEVLDAFQGRGVVRVYEHRAGAVLLERVVPGRPLVTLTLHEADDEATGVLAQTIQSMSPLNPPNTVATAADWGRGFDRYSESGDLQIPKPLVSAAHRLYRQLCGSQTSERLLHGDLHHYNILFDAERGWLAVDPKGVVAEPEYEVGAALRNPHQRPELFAAPSVIRRRVERLVRDLSLHPQRVLSWAFAQAVLAAIWAVEDASDVSSITGWIAMANALRPMLDGPADA